MQNSSYLFSSVLKNKRNPQKYWSNYDFKHGDKAEHTDEKGEKHS